MSKLWLGAGLLLFAACGGTGTGNPGSLYGNPTSNPQTAAETVLTASCSLLTSCFSSLSSAACTAGIKAQTGLGASLGLPANSQTFQSIIDDETAGRIRANTTALINCLSDIQALSCAGGAVQTSYSSAAPADFSHVSQLFSLNTSSCQGLY